MTCPHAVPMALLMCRLQRRLHGRPSAPALCAPTAILRAGHFNQRERGGTLATGDKLSWPPALTRRGGSSNCTNYERHHGAGAVPGLGGSKYGGRCAHGWSQYVSFRKRFRVYQRGESLADTQ